MGAKVRERCTRTRYTPPNFNTNYEYTSVKAENSQNIWNLSKFFLSLQRQKLLLAIRVESRVGARLYRHYTILKELLWQFFLFVITPYEDSLEIAARTYLH